VTGFVCTEQNEYDPELWVARNRMAHAWIEVYHPAAGWQTVELTPGSALPNAGSPSWSESFVEWLQSKWTRFKAIPWSELPAAAAESLQDFLLWLVGAWWRVALLLGGVAGFVFWRLRKRPPPPSPEALDLPPAVAEARATYLAQEGTLAPHGLARRPAETLLAQAERLRGVPWPAELSLEPGVVVQGIEALAAQRYAPSAASPSAGAASRWGLRALVPPSRPADPLPCPGRSPRLPSGPRRV